MNVLLFGFPFRVIVAILDGFHFDLSQSHFKFSSKPKSSEKPADGMDLILLAGLFCLCVVSGLRMDFLMLGGGGGGWEEKDAYIGIIYSTYR